MSPAQAASRRGGALVVLGAIVVGWMALRVALWEAPFVPATVTALSLEEGRALVERTDAASPDEPSVSSPAEHYVPLQPQPVIPQWQPAPLPRQVVPPVQYVPQPPIAHTALSRGFAAGRNLVAHVLMLQAGYRTDDTRSLSQRPPAFADARVVHAPRSVAEMRQPPAPSRWSMDAWALWREDSSSPLLSGRPSYGRSQIGAVMRYRLDPSSGHRPQLHLRGSMALAGENEREVALGASARPIPGVPVRVAVEGRLTETDRRAEPRAAAYAVSEFPPLGLPGGFTGELYVQGGYVTGEFATPFVDGQARITRELAGTDDFRLEAGGGAWGGAQEDADRLDVGPSAGVTFRVGEVRGRVSADYRFRVAGDAEPASGPALTLTAGF